MRLIIDKEADALLLMLREGQWKKSHGVSKYVSLQLGENDEVMAIEVLNLSGQSDGTVLDHLDLNFKPELEPYEVPLKVPLE